MDRLIDMYTYISSYIYRQIDVYIYIYIYIYMYVCIHAYVCMYVNMNSASRLSSDITIVILSSYHVRVCVCV